MIENDNDGFVLVEINSNGEAHKRKIEFDFENEEPILLDEIIEERPPKKRRRVEFSKKAVRKQLVERGGERLTKKKTIPAIEFVPQLNCKCSSGKKPRPDCSSKIGAERQKQIFDAYYQGMAWSQKTLFLRGSVKRHPVKLKKSMLYPLIPLKTEIIITLTH